MASTGNNSNGNAFEADSDAASTVFGLNSPSLYRNYPRVPFEYYININLANTGIALNYYNQYFVGNDFQQIQPLVKTIDMPSMKIDTVSMNQYNRKRLIQNKITYEPVKAVFHDVADGKTLAFWEMYYNFYYRDGLEPGTNSPTINSSTTIPYSNENFLTGGTQNFLQNVASVTSPVSTDGNKQSINDVLANNIVNQNFGYNFLNYDGSWPSNWDKQKYLIQSIEIFQVHGGRFNQVTLVNPRISAFTHDVLNYAGTDKTLELTFTFEYEYAYYNIDNEPLDSDQMKVFDANYLELMNTPFNVSTSAPYSIQTGNQTSNNSVPNIASLTGNNLQQPLSGVLSSQLGGLTSLSGIPNANLSSSSALSGLINISPPPLNLVKNPIPTAMSFLQTASSSIPTYVTGDPSQGITGADTYVPVDLSSPITGLA
jgi:hypothetical protein